jgi:diaminopimelate decarboxylase/aspartate kinase
MAMGEWLSTRAGAHYLGRYMDIDWVDARQALEVTAERNLSAARRWLSASCEAGPDPALNRRWSALEPVLITQGFIARVEDGRTALLGRGGSDTSAALLAGRLQARRLEIWTDVPGLFSADPRRVPAARLLRHVGYEEALEMAAGGARVVHPRCIRAAAETRTPLQIRDMARREVSGTRIDHSVSAIEGVKTITCKQNMAVLLLRNLDARHQVGFLADVFAVFRERGVSVDLVATSETTTTVAVNRDLNHLADHDLEKLQRELARYCAVESHPDCVCVNLVGQGVRKALSQLGGVMELFHEHPLLMASMSANDLCLSLLVSHEAHEQLLQQAHAALIPRGPMEPFGSTWQQVRAV